MQKEVPSGPLLFYSIVGSTSFKIKSLDAKRRPGFSYSRREATPLRGVAPASARICRQASLPSHHSPCAVVEHGFSCCAISTKKGPARGAFFRTRGGSRTHDPLLRRQLLYPTELLERAGANIKKNTDFCNDFRKPKQILDDTGKVCFVTFLSKNIRIVIPAPFFMLY